MDYFECPRCGKRSYNLNDIAHRYCAACHEFHDDRLTLPSHCADCGVLLMGGATRHKEGCNILALIREHFPNYEG